MYIAEMFKKPLIQEGGNVEIDGNRAQDIDLQVHNRTHLVGIFDKLLHSIANTFYSVYKEHLWSPELLNNKEFLSGSSVHFFNTKGISDDEFVRVKPKVGDIDTQCDANLKNKIEEFLKSQTGKSINGAKLIGYKISAGQFISLWELADPPIKVQIDLELGEYDTKTQSPSDWFKYSRASSWEDMQENIKGVFHKFLNRCLVRGNRSEKYVARVLKKSTKISPEPIIDSNYTFAVTSSQGGGLRPKYKPYIDPTTGEPKEINGIPVMQQLSSQDQGIYIQDLDKQFEIFFGHLPSKQDRELSKSFLGTLELANQNFTEEQNDSLAEKFLNLCFGEAGQLLYRDDVKRDRETKFAAINKLLEKLKLSNKEEIKQRANDLAKEFEERKSGDAGSEDELAEVGQAQMAPPSGPQYDSTGNSRLPEGDVIQTKFGTKQAQKGKTPYYKNPDIEVPMYDPIGDKLYRQGVSKGEPETFEKFDAIPSPSNKKVSHIVGTTKDGKRVVCSTAPTELANILAAAYNRGGFTDAPIEKIPLKTVADPEPEPPKPTKPDLKVVKEVKQRLDKNCWKGYRKAGTKLKSRGKGKGKIRVNKCVKVGESWEQEITRLVKLLEKKNN